MNLDDDGRKAFVVVRFVTRAKRVVLYIIWRFYELFVSFIVLFSCFVLHPSSLLLLVRHFSSAHHVLRSSSRFCQDKLSYSQYQYRTLRSEAYATVPVQSVSCLVIVTDTYYGRLETRD
jgi:hypothetical protein